MAARGRLASVIGECNVVVHGTTMNTARRLLSAGRTTRHAGSANTDFVLP